MKLKVSQSPKGASQSQEKLRRQKQHSLFEEITKMLKKEVDKVTGKT